MSTEYSSYGPTYLSAPPGPARLSWSSREPNAHFSPPKRFDRLKMESRIQEALAYLADFPHAKVATVAREFGVSRDRLQVRRRLAGIGPLESRPVTNTKLTAPEEVAVCRYIDRLDAINLAVKPAFVTDVANYILASRASPAEQDDPPVVGVNS